MGPAWAARWRSDARSGSPVSSRSASSMEAKGTSSIESTSIWADPTR